MPSRDDLFAAMAAASLLLACSDNPVSPDAGRLPPIRTDRESYVLYETSGGWMLRVEIPYTYQNTTGKTIYLVNCRQAVEASLEKQVDGVWMTAWGGVYAGCLSPAIEIAPGSVHADTMIVVHHPGGAPRFTVDPIEGTYRIVLTSRTTVHDYDESYASGCWGDSLPPVNRVSNAFALSK